MRELRRVARDAQVPPPRAKTLLLKLLGIYIVVCVAVLVTGAGGRRAGVGAAARRVGVPGGGAAAT